MLEHRTTPMTESIAQYLPLGTKTGIDSHSMNQIRPSLTLQRNRFCPQNNAQPGIGQ